MPSLKHNLAVAALITSINAVNAATTVVTAKSDNTFSPSEVKASKGDTIDFHFEAKNHSVVAGDYQYPCSPMQLGSGFFSGFLNAGSGEADHVFRITVNNTDPIPFYSSQGNECSDGMVGIINPNGKENLTSYKTRAAKLSRGVTPGTKAYGGKLVENSDADDGDSGKGSGGGSDGNSSSDDNKDSSASHLYTSLGFLIATGIAVCMV